MSTDNKRIAIKVPLKKILYDKDHYYDKLYDAIKNTNNIVTYGTFFIRSYILHSIENNVNITINKEFIKVSFKVISNVDITNAQGKPIKNMNLYNAIKDYYDNIYSIHVPKNTTPFCNLSYVLNYSYGQIYISMINNIKYHYDKHVMKYIKTSFSDKYDTLEKEEDIKEFNKELKRIHSDLLNETNKCNDSSKEWINTNKTIIVPEKYTFKKFERDIEDNTFEYLKCMYNINRFVQQKGKRSYQIFPIKTRISDNHIKINTQALIDIMYDNNKLEKLTNGGDPNIQEEVWNNVFQLKSQTNGEYLFKREGYSFNYEIDTDGYSVSLGFINNNEIPNKTKKKENFRKGRAEMNRITKEMTEEEREEYFKQKDKIKKDKEDKMKEEQKEKIRKKKEEFKKLSPEEQEIIKNKMNDKEEFPYINRKLKNKVFKEEFKKLYNEGKVLVCDPGKRSILYMVASNNKIHEPSKKRKVRINNFGISEWENKYNGKHKIMNYTSGTRRMFLKTKLQNKLIDRYLNKFRLSKRETIIKLKKRLLFEITQDLKYEKKMLKKMKKCHNSLKINKLKEESVLRMNKLKEDKVKYEKEIEEMMTSKERQRKRIKKEIKQIKSEIKMDENILEKVNKKTQEMIKETIKISIKQIKGLYKIMRGIKEKKKKKEINLKICDNKKFMEYVNYKLKNDKELKEKSKDNLKYLNKIKFTSYLNKMKHENDLVRIISREFGSDIRIVMGDWSSKGRIRYMPTPNLSIKRKLKTKFKIYHLDEHKTSKIHYKTNVKCENHKVEIKKKNNERLKKRLHAVLSYKKELGTAKEGAIEMGCINRDKNATMNMLKIVKSLLESGKIPVIFKRIKSTALPLNIGG